MQRTLSPHRAAFTVIELLCVITIMAVLSSMLLPAVGRMTDRANNLKCQNNLRQLGSAAHMAAQDRNGVFPAVEFDPANPAYLPEDNAKPLNEAFTAYGISAANLKCPDDVKGANHFARLGYSYMWKPQSADEETGSITLYMRRTPREVSLARVQFATDYEAVHAPDELGARKRMNAVYGDGRVISR